MTPLAAASIEHFDPLDGDLGPAAGRCTKVDDATAGLEDVEALIQLSEFEGGALAVAKAFRRAHVRVVELALQPAG